MKGRQKILVVEDNFATRTMLEHTLELEGYDVVALANGSMVADELAGPLPALVILDVMMPDVDGFTVLKRIRESDYTRELPVLMLTALDDADSTWQGWTGGCDYYMNKPFDTEDLLSVVQNLASGVAA
jgi:DNA-binding response OmpR family regulator